MPSPPGRFGRSGPGDPGPPPLPADELRVVDPSGRDVPPGGVGDCLRAARTPWRGYYKAEAYNSTAFTEDGFFRTGDLVRIDPEGRLIVVGRLKDVINRGGEKVSAAEVEAHLRAHPGVGDAALVAMPDARLGEKACARSSSRPSARCARGPSRVPARPGSCALQDPGPHRMPGGPPPDAARGGR